MDHKFFASGLDRLHSLDFPPYVIDLLHRNNDRKAKTVMMEKMHQKEKKSRKAPVHQVNQIRLRA